jgi:DNA-binding transcriptional regulator LsrR (DeoR family)
MYGKPLKDRLLFIAAAAFLKSKDQTQMQIAAALGVSQPEVSRLLEEAREKQWLEIAPRFRIVDQAVWQKSHERFFSTSITRDWLRETFPRGGKLLNRLTVLHLAPGAGVAIDRSTSDLVRSLLGDARTVGITWGSTISRLVEALRDSVEETPRRDRPHKMRFVPLCGEPLADSRDPSRFSSSVLAAQLSTIFNGANAPEPPPSIAGIPAFIPLKFNRSAEVKTIRRFLSGVRGYRRVFGADDQPENTTPPMINDLDAILSSVGGVDRARRGIFLSERIDAGDITEPELRRSVIGDIGGIIIPAEGISKEDRIRIDRMNERWTGVRLADLRRCADAALKSGFDRSKPGVLLFVLGKNRVDMVLRCVELGLVNELIIDQELEQAFIAYAKDKGVELSPAGS